MCILPFQRTDVGAVALNLLSKLRGGGGSSTTGRPSPLTAALDLADGTVCDVALLQALAAEIDARRAASGVLEGPASPITTNLQVRRNGLPEWWTASNNLMLAAPDASVADIQMGYMGMPISGAVVVFGADAKLGSLGLNAAGGFVVVGDRANLFASTISTFGMGTVLIGEQTTSTMRARIDARNGGIVLVGADSMWAHNVRFLTDDMHAIRDLETGKRLNHFGGRIVLERHVWLGEDVTLMGDCGVGADTIVGRGSFVKNVNLPPNSVCVGAPARAVRSGVTWSREDLP